MTLRERSHEAEMPERTIDMRVRDGHPSSERAYRRARSLARSPSLARQLDRLLASTASRHATASHLRCFVSTLDFSTPASAAIFFSGVWRRPGGPLLRMRDTAVALASAAAEAGTRSCPIFETPGGALLEAVDALLRPRLPWSGALLDSAWMMASTRYARGASGVARLCVLEEDTTWAHDTRSLDPMARRSAATRESVARYGVSTDRPRTPFDNPSVFSTVEVDMLFGGNSRISHRVVHVFRPSADGERMIEIDRRVIGNEAGRGGHG